jgi:outer membrane protein TolC
VLSDKYDKVASAKSAVTVQDKQLYLSKQDTILRVTGAYLRAVQAREQVKVREEAVSIAQKVADSAKKRADKGYAAGIEATRAELRVAQTRNQLQIQQQDAKGAIESLMLAIGAGVGETPELVDNVPEQLPEIPSLEEALKAALKNRPELVIADERITNQERLLAIAKDQLRPSLDMVAGFNSIYPDQGLISRSILDLGAFAAGLQYKVPLDRRAVREEREIAARDLETLKKLRTYQLEGIAEEVGRACRACESQKTTLKIFTDNLQVAQENLLLANRMVDEANGTNRDVLDAQEALTQTQGSILSAKTELYLAVLNLKNAMGEDLNTIGQQ